MSDGEVLVGIFVIPTMKEFQIYLDKASYSSCSYVSHTNEALTFNTIINLGGGVRMEVQVKISDILCIEQLAK